MSVLIHNMNLKTRSGPKYLYSDSIKNLVHCSDVLVHSCSELNHSYSELNRS